MRLTKLTIILLLSISFEAVIGQGNENTETEKKLNCYDCNSDDTNCLNDLSKLTLIECAVGEVCFAKVDGGKVIRGCAKEAGCPADSCKSCNYDKCNDNNVCQKCDSTKDATCVKLTAINSSFYEICAKKDTKCLIKISDKATVRHCASDAEITACTDEKTCHKCDEVNCNNFIFPKNRIRCHQCNSSTKDTCKSVETNTELVSEPCPLYVENDKCYMFGEDENKIIRGCVSDTADENKCKSDSTNERCSTCSTDNCNHSNYKRKQNIQCIQCSSTQENTKCMWGQSENEAKDCTNLIEYYKKDACYTDVKDKLVHRGCLFDRAVDAGECKDNCSTCTDKSGCNNKDEASFTCIRCRDDTDKKCKDDAANAKSLDDGKCRNAVTEENSTCFRGRWNGVVIRGCLVDADERMQAVCAANSTNTCEICKTVNCNSMKTTKDGAASLSGFMGLLTVFITLLIQQL